MDELSTQHIAIRVTNPRNQPRAGRPEAGRWGHRAIFASVEALEAAGVRQYKWEFPLSTQSGRSRLLFLDVSLATAFPARLRTWVSS